MNLRLLKLIENELALPSKLCSVKLVKTVLFRKLETS